MPQNKSGHFYYPWYPLIFYQKTLHLSLAESGAYRALIDHYMVSRSPIPNGDKVIARILGCSLEEWLSVKAAIINFFEEDDNGCYVHDFCERELQEDMERREESRINGSKGGKKRIENAKIQATLQPPLDQPLSHPSTPPQAHNISYQSEHIITKQNNHKISKHNSAVDKSVNRGDKDDPFLSVFDKNGLDDDYDIFQAMTPKGYEAAKIAANDDEFLYMAGKAFNQMIANGGDKPIKPDKAFPAFVKTYNPMKGRA